MTYTLTQLAAGAYDLLLDGEIIGSVVSVKTRTGAEWYAELLEDRPDGRRPAPFQEVEHRFVTLAEVCAWLGNPEIKQLTRADASH